MYSTRTCPNPNIRETVDAGKVITITNQPQIKPTEKTLKDNIYYLGSAKQAEDYEKTSEFFIHSIGSFFKREMILKLH